MHAAGSDVHERLDHVGMVVGVCQDIGLAYWLDEHDPTTRQVVRVGTAITAMILHGLGESLRQVSLVPHDGATRLVEQLWGRGISADLLTDEC